MKKILAIALVIALLSTLAIGTTLSYFKDTAYEKDTMTVGNVKITQTVTSGSTALRPYIGTIPADNFVDANNAVTKNVTVTNIGSESAYIRTLFAFEAVNQANPVGTKVHADYNKTDGVGTWASEGEITVGTVKYYVYSFTYTNEVLGGNTTTVASLEKIALDCSVENDFADQIVGDYDILIVSQAVQSTGFTAIGTKSAAEVAFEQAFGALNASWFAAPQQSN